MPTDHKPPTDEELARWAQRHYRAEELLSKAEAENERLRLDLAKVTEERDKYKLHLDHLGLQVKHWNEQIKKEKQ